MVFYYLCKFKKYFIMPQTFINKNVIFVGDNA